MFGLGKKKLSDDELVKLKEEKRELEQKIFSLGVDVERMEKKALEAEKALETLKHKHKLEEESIKHLVKINEERLEIEKDKAVNKAKADAAKGVAEVKDQYRDKMEKQLVKEGEKLMSMYEQVLARLPDVNVMLGDRAKKDNG